MEISQAHSTILSIADVLEFYKGFSITKQANLHHCLSELNFYMVFVGGMCQYVSEVCVCVSVCQCV